MDCAMQRQSPLQTGSQGRWILITSIFSFFFFVVVSWQLLSSQFPLVTLCRIENAVCALTSLYSWLSSFVFAAAVSIAQLQLSLCSWTREVVSSSLLAVLRFFSIFIGILHTVLSPLLSSCRLAPFLIEKSQNPAATQRQQGQSKSSETLFPRRQNN